MRRPFGGRATTSDVVAWIREPHGVEDARPRPTLVEDFDARMMRENIPGIVVVVVVIIVITIHGRHMART